MWRFFNKIERLETGCWMWLGCKTNHGYGKFSLGRRWVLAHRFAFELFRSEIPFGLTLDHLCRNSSCVNPFHVQPVDQRTNVLRGMGLASLNAKKTHCKHGHEFTVENTFVGANRKRRCRKCWSVDGKRRYWDKRRLTL
jgi:hypothetical protein